MVQGRGDTAQTVTITPTESEVQTVFRSWLLSVLGAPWQALQGQQNQSALPLDQFAVFTIISRMRLATNNATYTDTTRETTDPTRLTIQVGTFGTGAGDAIQRVVALFRDSYAADWFRANDGIAAPLYASEPRNTAFVNDSNQFEDNWSADLHMQVNFTVAMPQQFATSITATLIEVDTTYRPME